MAEWLEHSVRVSKSDHKSSGVRQVAAISPEQISADDNADREFLQILKN